MPQHPDHFSALELGSKYLISETRSVLTNKESWSWKFKGLKESSRWDRKNTLDVRVSPKNIGPALAFMKAFIDYGLEQGHDVIVKYGETKVVIQGQEEQIFFRELTRVIERDPSDKYGSRQYEPTGVLTFKASWSFQWKEGTNGQTLIEQIPKMYDKLEARIDDLLAGWERSRIAREKEESEERRLAEIENRKMKELQAFRQLLDQSLRWQRANNLRKYLEEACKIKSDSEPTWSAWALAKVNWYDPMVNAEDELLDNVNRDTLKFIDED